MAPTFTIFQDPPSATSTRASNSTALTSTSASVRSLGRSSSSSTPMLALDVDKENVDPTTGLSRTTLTKPKAKKALSSKNKDNSKALSKASKASRGGSATPGPAKPAKSVRTSPYHSISPLPVSELSFQLANSLPASTPCLISGFSVASLSDFAEPEFDLYSDFVDQPSPTRSRPDSMWSSALPCVAETQGDRKARDLTELPLADLSEAFAIGTKKPTYQEKAPPSNELIQSLFGGASAACLSPSAFQTTPSFERQPTLIVDVGSNVRLF